jgi:hypothetical protein
MIRPSLLVAAALLGAALPIRAQSLKQRIHQTRDGEVRLGFASRPDVCGDGLGTIQSGENHSRTEGYAGNWGRPCLHGPVMVVLQLRDGRVRKVKTTVGPEWPAARAGVSDLGLLPAADAARTLVQLGGEDAAAADAIFPATLADSAEIWPDLLALARRTDAPGESRKQAIFWLGQAAGDRATAGLTELADAADDQKEIRESAVFALSQLHDGSGVTSLIKLARTSRHGDVRRNALFWLGQSDDPRALDLFEELLVRN